MRVACLVSPVAGPGQTGGAVEWAWASCGRVTQRVRGPKAGGGRHTRLRKWKQELGLLGVVQGGDGRGTETDPELAGGTGTENGIGDLSTRT